MQPPAPDSLDGSASPTRVGGRWAKGDAYERYLGRWSARLAPAFVDWVGISPAHRTLDVGCGTGALIRAVLGTSGGRDGLVVGVDPSAGFLTTAVALSPDPRASFLVAPAQRLPFPPGAIDVVISGLVLNFLPDPLGGVREMARVCRRGGTVAGYVWDYHGEMWVLRHFWDTVFELFPDARDLAEVRRFAACKPEPLLELFTAAGLTDVTVEHLDGTADFADFYDYWAPFLAGQGGAPSFVVGLPEHTRTAVADALLRRLPIRSDRSLSLDIRVWAVRGRVRDKTA